MSETLEAKLEATVPDEAEVRTPAEAFIRCEDAVTKLGEAAVQIIGPLLREGHFAYEPYEPIDAEDPGDPMVLFFDTVADAANQDGANADDVVAVAEAFLAANPALPPRLWQHKP